MAKIFVSREFRHEGMDSGTHHYQITIQEEGRPPRLWLNAVDRPDIAGGDSLMTILRTLGSVHEVALEF